MSTRARPIVLDLDTDLQYRLDLDLVKVGLVIFHRSSCLI